MREEDPGGEELADDRLPGGDRHGEQQFERARAALLRPQAHADRGHQHQVQPGMPAEERAEARLAALEELAGGEGEEAGQQQEDHQEHVGHRRGEVGDELALGDGADGVPGVLMAFTVSGRVRRRNTSSSGRPSSSGVPLADDAAAVDDDGARAGGVDFLEDVGREHDRLVLAQLADQVPHLVLLVRVEAVGGLVQDQHLGIVDQRLREAGAVLVALGQRVDRLVQHRRQEAALDRARRWPACARRRPGRAARRRRRGSPCTVMSG